MKLKKLHTFLFSAVAASALSMSAQADTIKLKLATDSGAKGSPAGEAIEHWAAQIEQRTQGTDDEISVDIFYQDELGDQKEVFDLLVVGEVDMMLNWPLTSYDKKMGLRNTPYLFLNWEQAFDAYKDGGWLNKINGDIHADLGLKYFGAWPEGFAGVASKGRYATTVEGAKGMKVRVPSNFPNPQTLQAMGYQATAITWGEVYTSIQTGVVDGDAGNTIYWDYEYFRDVLDYYVRTKHTFVTGALSMNMEVWDELSDNQKSIVSEAAADVMAKQFKEARTRDQYYIDQATASGMEYVELNDEELRTLAKVAREKVWPLMVDELGEEIVQKLKDQAPAL
jgi:TRAP-type C4-dicarboxylate transport system substrate-binding protein